MTNYEWIKSCFETRDAALEYLAPKLYISAEPSMIVDNINEWFCATKCPVRKGEVDTDIYCTPLCANITQDMIVDIWLGADHDSFKQYLVKGEEESVEEYVKGSEEG